MILSKALMAFDQVLESTGGHPLVTAPPEGGLASLAQPSCHVPGTAGDQPEQDGLEAVALGDPGSMAPQRVVGFPPRLGR